jgi:hypothetical protein
MHLRGVISATLACSLAGCLDTKADMPSVAADGGAWAGAGSVKPPLAQANAGSPWIVQAGTGAAPPARGGMQPSAAGQRATPSTDAGARRDLPLVRARSMDAGELDAGAYDAAAPEEEPTPERESTFDGGFELESFDGGVPDASAQVPESESQYPLVEHPGDLVITELMIDPKALSDTQGEWIELYNASEATLELRDCQLDDGAKSLHDIPAALVEPGAYFTLAREAEPGFVADLVVPLSLTNSADSVAIICRGQEIDRVSYDAEFAIKAGVSLALDPEQLDASANDLAGAWCQGSVEYATDLGSPGQANSSCYSEPAQDSEWEEPEHEEPDEEGCYAAPGPSQGY